MKHKKSPVCCPNQWEIVYRTYVNKYYAQLSSMPKNLSRELLAKLESNEDKTSVVNV